jgi:hypothetical protein
MSLPEMIYDAGYFFVMRKELKVTTCLICGVEIFLQAQTQKHKKQ